MLVFFAFLVGKVLNIPTKYGFPIRTTKICLISVPVIFSVPRRGIIKSCKEISRNYGSSGPFLDTIIYNFLLSETERTWSFHYVVGNLSLTQGAFISQR